MDGKEKLEAIKEAITIDQMAQLLEVFDAAPQLQGNIIISRTICHGGDTHKLYYYDNTKLFKCYTDCPEDSFDIFNLVMKVNKYELPQAVNFVIDFFNLYQFEEEGFKNEDNLEDWKILDNYLRKISQNNKEERKIELKYYDKKLLSYLPHPHILNWEKEGIKYEVIRQHQICYNPSTEAIVIPHFDKDNNLVGIRERTLIKENEIYGKYRPMLLNRKLYNHPLGFNLYNLNNSKDNINILKRAIVFEGEKSPLLYASYFGQENDISVACCGSNLSSYQIDLLVAAGAAEIIIAFDKQFKNIGDNEWKLWTHKLTNISMKYNSKVKISFMFDKWNLLGYKDAPIDCGKEKFLQLFKERVSL